MSHKRLFLLIGLLFSLFTVLLGRIFYFQVIKGEEISRQAVAMRTHNVDLRDQIRGDILDRNLFPLTNTNTSTAVFFSNDIAKAGSYEGANKNNSSEEYVKEISEFLAEVLINTSEAEIQANLNAAAPSSQFILVKNNLTPTEIEQLRTAAKPGLIIAPMTKRYDEGGFCAHLLGYTNQCINSTGQTGLERAYDDILRYNPNPSGLVTVVDARGQAIPGLTGKYLTASENKSSLVLTIDKRIQEVAEKAMDSRAEKGAAVVMDIHSKEILAMVSRPAFDPYQINDAIEFDGRSPLTNRVLSRYNPGSLFKILLTSAALEEGFVNLDERFYCSGKYIFNDQVAISCLKKEGHGELSFEEAFAKSCNPTFIQVGLRLGRPRLLHYVEQFHLTDETIIGFEPGQIGTYVKIDGGDAAMGNASLGQEGVMVTPLQVASLLSTVADGGIWAAPSVVRYTIDKNGNKTEIKSGERKQVISVTTAQNICSLMKNVVDEGTGRTAAIPETKVAGKTATAQTGRMIDEDNEVLNTWFAGFFPADQPRWAVVVMVEEGSSGSQTCAPIFKDISRGILQYF